MADAPTRVVLELVLDRLVELCFPVVRPFLLPHGPESAVVNGDFGGAHGSVAVAARRHIGSEQWFTPVVASGNPIVDDHRDLRSCIRAHPVLEERASSRGEGVTAWEGVCVSWRHPSRPLELSLVRSVDVVAG